MSTRNIFNEISAALLTMPAVTSLVGSNPLTCRIWNSWERVNAYPCLVIEIDKEEEQNDLGGVPDLVVAEVTITARDNSEAGAHALQQAVRNNGTSPGTGLAGYHGTFDAVLDDTVRSSTPKDTGGTANWYDQVMTFTMLWNEP